MLESYKPATAIHSEKVNIFRYLCKIVFLIKLASTLNM